MYVCLSFGLWLEFCGQFSWLFLSLLLSPSWCMARVADYSRLRLLHLAPSYLRLTQLESRNLDAVDRAPLSSKPVFQAHYSAE